MNKLWALLLSAPLFAHVTISTRITWSKEVSRIVYQRCVSCHREGGASTISLVTYDEARPWAKAIQEAVLSRQMPPWGAVKGFGEFANDQGLTQEEINLIAEWAEGGAPEGDASLMPSVPRRFDPPPKPKGMPMQVAKKLRVPNASTITALRTASAAQVIARLPDGAIEPLLWVQFPLKKPQLFTLREPLKLPAGSTIETTAPVYAYLTTPSRPHRTTPYLPAPDAQTAPTRGAGLPSGKSR